jgi:hypothetical protein
MSLRSEDLGNRNKTSSFSHRCELSTELSQRYQVILIDNRCSRDVDAATIEVAAMIAR